MACGGGGDGMPADVMADAGSSIPVDAAPPVHYVFFTDATSPESNTSSLYRYAVADQQVTVVGGGYEDVTNGELVNHHGKIYFAGRTAATGHELWVLDPAAPIVSGTNPKMIADLVVGAIGSAPQHFLSTTTGLYFSADEANDATVIYRYDDTLAASATNPRKLELPAGTVTQQNALVDLGGRVYFDGADNTHGLEWYVFDPALPVAVGTNPSIIESIVGVDSIAPAGEAIVFGARLLFHGYTNAAGHELFIYDPALPVSVDNPKLAADLAPGAASSYPIEFSIANGNLFFQADGTTVGRELWRFDSALAPSSTNPGPLDLRPGAAGLSSDLGVVASGNYVLFRGDAVNGLGPEPWLLDATQPIGTGNPVEHDVIPGVMGAASLLARGCLDAKFCYGTYESDASYVNVLDPTVPFSPTNPIRIPSAGVGNGSPSAFTTWSN